MLDVLAPFIGKIFQRHAPYLILKMNVNRVSMIFGLLGKVIVESFDRYVA